MTPFTLDENVLSATLSGTTSFALTEEFQRWKNNTLQDFSDKIVQILNMTFTTVIDNSSNRIYLMNIIYRIGG